MDVLGWENNAYITRVGQAVSAAWRLALGSQTSPPTPSGTPTPTPSVSQYPSAAPAVDTWPYGPFVAPAVSAAIAIAALIVAILALRAAGPRLRLTAVVYDDDPEGQRDSVDVDGSHYLIVSAFNRGPGEIGVDFSGIFYLAQALPFDLPNPPRRV